MNMPILSQMPGQEKHSNSERGASLVEYALILGLVMVILFVFREVFWSSVVSYYSNNNNQFNYIDTPVYVPD